MGGINTTKPIYFLPFQIHESMRPASISENLFIKIFDICSAVLLILSYILTRSGFAAYEVFSEGSNNNKVL